APGPRWPRAPPRRDARDPPRPPPLPPRPRPERPVGLRAPGPRAQAEAGEGARPLPLHRDGERAGGATGSGHGVDLLLAHPGSQPGPRTACVRRGPEPRVLPAHEPLAARLPLRLLAVPRRPRLHASFPRHRPPAHGPDAGRGALVRVPVLD